MSFAKYIQDKLSKTMAPSTYRARSQFLLRVANDAKDFSFINDTHRIIRILDGYKNINSRWSNLMSIVVAMKADPSVINESTVKIFDDYISKLKDERDAHLKHNVKTTKQVERLDKPLKEYQALIISLFDDLQKKYNLSITKTHKISSYSVKRLGPHIYSLAKDYQDILILALYILQPALRSNWSSMRFTDKVKDIDDKHNWLVLSKNVNYIHMSKFKNVASFGIANIELELAPMFYLTLWISILKAILKKNPEFVIHYEINKTLHTVKHVGKDDALAKNIPRIAKRILGKELSINDFRHMWEIDIQTNEQYKSQPMDVRENLHRKLLHSQNIAQLYNVQDE